jgi:hypothetical protein
VKLFAYDGIEAFRAGCRVAPYIDRRRISRKLLCDDPYRVRLDHVGELVRAALGLARVAVAHVVDDDADHQLVDGPERRCNLVGLRVGLGTQAAANCSPRAATAATALALLTNARLVIASFAIGCPPSRM